MDCECSKEPLLVISVSAELEFYRIVVRLSDFCFDNESSNGVNLRESGSRNTWMVNFQFFGL